ncbi:MAG: Holliday junction branch migration protein RuvA [Deltaproteobacteria bacterium]|nr:Holliday junction branch migration protein RuvA [Deltaproteobacteria bacterium]
MISWLEGTLREKHPDRLLLDVRGVGYELLISLATFGGLPDVGKTLSIYARTVAREDALLLYGFGTARERDIFELLLRANRIGPKLAQDVKLLCSAPGVGKKMAERMVVELREKAAELGSDPRGGIGLPPQSEPETGADLETRGQALSALLNLGYSRAQAERVVEAAAREAGEGASIEGLIRNALRRLAR